MAGGLYPPPAVIASWPKPNYVDPVTQGPALTFLCIFFSVLSLAVVTARIYSRVFITKVPGIDDILIAVALAFAIALSVLIIIEEKVWLVGRHIWDTPVKNFSAQRRITYISEWCYLTATCSVKISILLFYKRLSVTFSKTFLIATWVGILYNVLFGVAYAIALLALFKPINSYWLSFDPAWAATHKYVHGNEAWSLPSAAAFSVIGDFYSTVLPLMLIGFLDLPPRQKAALHALFGLGFLVVAAGIVRTVMLVRITSQTYDATWVLWESWIWIVIELNVSILAASAPALKPFFRRFVIDPIVRSGRHGSSTFDSHRRSSRNRVRGAKRFGWSKDISKARDSNIPVDMEKIGIALTKPQSKAEMIEDEIDDGVSMRQYQLRTSRDGKLVPVQIYEQSSHTANSSDYILPPTKAGELPPIPSQKQYQHSPGTQNNVRHNISSPLDRNPSRSSAPSRSGSAKGTQVRVQQLQEFEQGHNHSRSISAGSGRNFSLPSTTPVGSSPYRHYNNGKDTYMYERNSSEETLGLPR